MTFDEYKTEIQSGKFPAKFDIFFDMYVKDIAASIKDKILLFGEIQLDKVEVSASDITALRISNGNEIGYQLSKLINLKGALTEPAKLKLQEYAEKAYIKHKALKGVPIPYVKIKHIELYIQLLKIIQNIKKKNEITHGVDSFEEAMVFGLKQGILANGNGWLSTPEISSKVLKFLSKKTLNRYTLLKTAYELKQLRIR